MMKTVGEVFSVNLYISVPSWKNSLRFLCVLCVSVVLFVLFRVDSWIVSSQDSRTMIHAHHTKQHEAHCRLTKKKTRHEIGASPNAQPLCSAFHPFYKNRILLAACQDLKHCKSSSPVHMPHQFRESNVS